MRLLSRLLLPLLILALPGCGNGTLADIWASFPEDAFVPGDGEVPGPPPGGVTLTEVAAIAGGQGVTGTVTNIAVGTVAGDAYAFLAAGTSGCHVVDVTEPDLINASSYVTTIRDAVLGTSTIAGGRVDDVAVVGDFLVCLAVAPSATNAITVFHLPTLITAATSPSADLSGAFVAPAPGSEIAVTGDAQGKGGGVSGGTGNFFVATGTAVVHALVSPSGWSLAPTPSLDLGTPAFTSVTDVIANQTTAVYASGLRSDGKFGLAVLGHPALPVPSTPVFLEVSGEIQRVVDDFVAAPGSYPLDLAIDTLSLYVTGNNEIFVYNVTNPLLPSLSSTITETGSKTIAVNAGGGAFVTGAGDAIRSGTAVLGQARVTGVLTFPGTYTIRGVALRSTSTGSFALVCAGTGGLRVVEVPRATGP